MGSPPRGRGKGHACHQAAVVVGITPAQAGKRNAISSRAEPDRDHPRIGGEKSVLMLRLRLTVGLPPHRRGKGQVGFRQGRVVGITPAWAGKSARPARWGRCAGDHPRMGGEKLLFQLGVLYPLGSPPHGRGKDRRSADHSFAGGITPAWAGKRTRSWRAYGCPWDHPRVGGEKWFIALLFEPCEGSPPAWAGKSLFCFAAAVPIQDHPRMGGEKVGPMRWYCGK